MAKTFLFRVTQEGVDELKKNLEALGPAGKTAFDTIASASPRLADSLGQAQSRMDQTRSRLEALKTAGESTAVAFETLNRGLALFGVGLGIEKVIEFGKRSIENVGALKDLSTQIGVTTRDFQTYQYAARQNGVATQAWQSGLAVLTRQIGDAAAGNKDAIDLFRRLGIAFKDASGNARDTGEEARDLAQRVHDSASAAQQFAIVNDALGKTGRALIPIFKGGADGLDKFAISAKNAGEVLSDETIERLNRADTTFKNLGAHLEIFFAEGIDNGIEVGKAFAYMAEQAAKFAERKIDISKITDQIAELQRELKHNLFRFENDKQHGLKFYTEENLREDQRRIGELIQFYQSKLVALTTPPQSKPVVPPESSFEKPGRSGSGAGTFKYQAASNLGPALQAGDDQIAILRQVAGLSSAQRAIKEAQLSAFYGAKRNTDPAISGAADQFGDQARTQAILKQGQAIADQNRQIALNTELTGKAADAWLKSDAAGQRADAQRQAALEELTTGYSATARAAEILEQQASQAAEKGAQQLAQLQQQAADAQAQANAAASGPAALAAEQLAEKIAAATKSLKASLENAAGDDAVRLQHDIDGITDSLTRADEAAKKLRLETSLLDQQDELAALREQYALVGQISGVQAVQVAHLEAINKLQREGVDLNSAAAKSYVSNAEQIAGLKDKLEISQREAELQLEPYKNAIQGLQSTWTDGWEKALSGQIDTFSDFFSSIKQIGVRWAAEMASLLTFKPIAGSVLGSIAPELAQQLGLGNSGQAIAAAQNAGVSGIGGSSGGLGAIFGGSGSGGIGSWLNSLFGSSATNAAGYRATGAGPFASANGALPGWAGFLNSGVGTGLVGGATAAGATAASGGSTLQTAFAGGGALLGGIAGAYFGGSGGAALGSAGGGFLGNLLGGLFGDKKRKPPRQQSITNIDALSSGYFGATDTTTKHSSDLTSGLGRDAAGALNTFLASIGGTVSGGQSGQVSYDGRTPRFKSQVGGVTSQFGSDAQGAQDAVADFIARTIVDAAKSDRLKGASEAVKTAIANSGALDSDTLDAAVTFGKFFDRIDQIRTPAQSAAQAVADLAAEMQKASGQAEQYGLDVAKIPEIFKANFIDTITDQILQLQDPAAYALKQLEIEKAAAIAQAQSLGADINSVEQLYGLKRQAIVEQGLQGVTGSFQNFFNSLLTDSNLSALSPQEQYKQTKASFEGASGQDIISAATPFLQASRAMFASTADYVSDYREVLEKIKSAGGLTSDIPAFAKGGMHDGGYMIAGEHGPELVASGAARVYDAKTTAAIMSAANADLSPPLMAKIVKSLGQGPDTELVHMRSDELSAAMTWWGGMTVNPATGLPSFLLGSAGGGHYGSGSSRSSGSWGGGSKGKSSAGGSKNAAFAAAAAVQTKKVANPAVNPGNKNLGLAGPDYSGPTGYGTGVDPGNPSNAPGKMQDKGGKGWDSSFGPAPASALNAGGFFDASKVVGSYDNGASGAVNPLKNGPVDIDKFMHDWADYQGVAYGDLPEDTFWDKVGNFVASMFGFNEMNPLTDAAYNKPGNPAGFGADWGFDPAGLIGTALGSIFGIPLLGTAFDQLSSAFGRPLEMALGPSVLGSPDVPADTAGLSNALAVQGASDISIGSTTISANPSPASGVLAGGDIPRALSNVVTGGQNSVSDNIQSGFDRTAKGNEALAMQIQELIRVNKSMDESMRKLLNAQSQTNDVLKVQARGTTKI